MVIWPQCQAFACMGMRARGRSIWGREALEVRSRKLKSMAALWTSKSNDDFNKSGKKAVVSMIIERKSQESIANRQLSQENSSSQLLAVNSRSPMRPPFESLPELS